MRVGPSGSLSGAGLKPARAAAVKSRGGERRVKSPGRDPGQVSVGKTSASKSFEDASLTYQVLSKPGGIVSSDQDSKISSPNASVVGGNCPSTQSTPARVDRVLRAVHTFGVAAFVPTRQSDAVGLGSTEVQAL
jgi:hypothetical protein